MTPTYSLGDNFGSRLLFYLLTGVASPGVVWPARLGLRVVGLRVGSGVALKGGEVLGGRGATVEKVSVKVWVVPEAHGSLTSAGLAGRSSRTLSSVEARSLRCSLVVPGDLIGIPLLSDFLWIPAHTCIVISSVKMLSDQIILILTKGADIREVDITEEPKIILGNIIECLLLERSHRLLVLSGARSLSLRSHRSRSLGLLRKERSYLFFKWLESVLVWSRSWCWIVTKSRHFITD